MKRESNELAETVGPFWTEREVHAAMGQDGATGPTLAVTTTDGVTLYPASQFVTVQGRTAVSSGIAAMLTVLEAFDPWAVAVLMEAPAEELDGASPLQWISDGHGTQRLVDLAEQVAREWTSGSHSP